MESTDYVVAVVQLGVQGTQGMVDGVVLGRDYSGAMDDLRSERSSISYYAAGVGRRTVSSEADDDDSLVVREDIRACFTVLVWCGVIPWIVSLESASSGRQCSGRKQVYEVRPAQPLDGSSLEL